MVFINAFVLFAAVYVFDSHYEETIDGELNSANVMTKMINDYFAYEY